MKVLYNPNTPAKIGILDSTRKNRRIPFLFNTVLEQIVKKHHIPANINTGTGYIELPRATKEVLAELKKLHISYEHLK